MGKKYTMPDDASPAMARESLTVAATPNIQLHLDITLEENAVVSDIKKALKMIKGIASVKVAHPKVSNAITPALAHKIEEARKDYAEGRYTECKTEEELTAFLDSL